MALRQEEAIARWVRDICSTGLLRRSYRSSGVFANPDGQLMYERKRSERRRAWGPVELATWLPESRTFLLNGDGFTDGFATQWQTHLRTVVQGSIRDDGRGWNQVPIPPGTAQMVVPYVALRAAGVDLLSIKPIEVSLDRNEEVRHDVPPPPPMEKFKPPKADDTSVMNNPHRRQILATVKGLRYSLQQRNASSYRHRETGEIRTRQPYNHELHQYERIDNWVDDDAGYAVWQAGRRLDAGWMRLDSEFDDDGEGQLRYFWTENIHHLGAAVFYANDGSGRKRFISAFDEDEPNQMYFLAQLPAKGKIRTYDDAVDALAPPIVHEARRTGRRVVRQGDVFAIETDRTDEWVYSNARTRVRRDVALWEPNHRHPMKMPKLEPLDTRERVSCPCCDQPAWSGWGPRARRSLMIYGTGHTATEVVVVSGGAVYVRGTMHHDPNLEEAGRRREHVDLHIGDQKKWFLAVRNTVPRRSGSSDSNQREEDAA